MLAAITFIIIITFRSLIDFVSRGDPRARKIERTKGGEVYSGSANPESGNSAPRQNKLLRVNKVQNQREMVAYHRRPYLRGNKITR